MSVFGNFYQLIEGLLGLYNNSFDYVYNDLYDYGGYTNMGLILVFIPIFFTGWFYFFNKYPYVKKWHWGVMILISSIFVFGFTFSIANTAIAQSTGYPIPPEISSLPFNYSIFNAFVSIIIGFIYSLGMRPLSKCQMHLPF